MGLESGRYVLWVGRLEPETRVEELIEAFGKASMEGFKLVVLGDAPFADDYKQQLYSREPLRSYSPAASSERPTSS